MMKIVFIADEFELRSPVQQLLDRFLVGYPDGGVFHRLECEVTLVIPRNNREVERRMKDFGLKTTTEVVKGDAAMIFSRSLSAPPAPRCFVYGAPLEGVPGLAGTAVRGAWLLPEIAVAKSARLAKGLVIVQGAYPSAEIEALDALLPLIWREQVSVRRVTRLDGNNFWDVLRRDFWPLVKSAISRSDSPQGDPVRDGRPQDIVGLGLLESLVKSPRGWLIEQEDGFMYVLAVMDGAVADYNVAVQTAAGGIISAQAYRPPAPMEHHYSRLAAALERYFRTGSAPWPVEQNLLTLELLDRFDQGQSLQRR